MQATSQDLFLLKTYNCTKINLVYLLTFNFRKACSTNKREITLVVISLLFYGAARTRRGAVVNDSPVVLFAARGNICRTRSVMYCRLLCYPRRAIFRKRNAEPRLTDERSPRGNSRSEQSPIKTTTRLGAKYS